MKFKMGDGGIMLPIVTKGKPSETQVFDLLSTELGLSDIW